MKPKEWYKTSDFENILNVKERRIKILLCKLVEAGKIIDDGKIKGKNI